MYKYINMLNSDIYWKKYNYERDKLVKKINKHNKEHSFNYFEDNNYNHVRDLLALTLTKFDHKKKINVLDFGSNLLTISNLVNKINTSNLFFTIYDPFSENCFKKVYLKKINYEIINNTDNIYKKKYDLINFGSSIQYQDNFFQILSSFNLLKTKFITITSTPMSLKNTYFCKQANNPNLTQKIYSLNSIVSKLKRKKFKLIFKSINDHKYVACKKQKYKSLSLNLIFFNE